MGYNAGRKTLLIYKITNMTKKKKSQVIKLDKSTMSSINVSTINVANNIIRHDVSFIVKQMKELSAKVSALDYSGHKYLSDTVIRLQRNANSAAMVAEILLDILKYMANEELLIIQQLNEEVDNKNIELNNKNNK